MQRASWHPDFDYSHLKPDQERYGTIHGIGGDTHFTPDYQIGLKLGWGGLLEKVRRYRSLHGPEKAGFYQAEEDVILAVQTWMRHTIKAIREALAGETGVELVHVDEIDNHADIDGLAALIGACDVIVTVSNTTAHLAAALGRKVLLLLPFSQGLLWYWHHGRTDSPWYADVRLYRQGAPGDWRDAVTQIGTAVAELAGEPGAAE